MLPEHTVLPAPNTITQLQPPSHLPHQATSSHHKVLKSTAVPQLTMPAPLQLTNTNMFLYNKREVNESARCWTNLQDVNTRRWTSFILKVAMPSSCYRWPVCRHDRTSVSWPAPPNVVRMHYLWSSITETDYGAKRNLAPVTCHKYFKKIIQMYIFL